MLFGGVQGERARNGGVWGVRRGWTGDRLVTLSLRALARDLNNSRKLEGRREAHWGLRAPPWRSLPRAPGRLRLGPKGPPWAPAFQQPLLWAALVWGYRFHRPGLPGLAGFTLISSQRSAFLEAQGASAPVWCGTLQPLRGGWKPAAWLFVCKAVGQKSPQLRVSAFPRSEAEDLEGGRGIHPAAPQGQGLWPLLGAGSLGTAGLCSPGVRLCGSASPPLPEP